MNSSRTILVLCATALLGASAGVGRLGAEPQPPAAEAAAHKSVYGKLQSVDQRLNAVIMVSDAGDRLAWRFEPAVVAEVARFEPGSAMVVIYRQISANEKRVTAVAFPGAADAPTYVNVTGARVVLRSGPAVAGACGQADAGTVQETVVPDGGRAETAQACWCCAAPGQACTPANKTGTGQALLVRCFE